MWSFLTEQSVYEGEQEELGWGKKNLELSLLYQEVGYQEMTDANCHK